LLRHRTSGRARSRAAWHVRWAELPSSRRAAATASLVAFAVFLSSTLLLAASTVWVPLFDAPLVHLAVTAFALEENGYLPGRDFRVTREGLFVDARCRDEILAAIRMIAPQSPAVARTLAAAELNP
jgi:hypothetical protein